MRLAIIIFSTIFPLLALAAGPSSRPGMGAIPYADAGGTGVTFRVWAPNATSVGVKGQFNGWSATSMTLEGTNGYWSADIPSAQVGQQYKYVINGSLDRRDPRSRRVTNSAGNSIIYKTNAFDWGGDVAIPPWKNDLVIYEMHVGTFNAEGGVPSSFDKDIERLDYLRSLGISAVEIMPVNEFPADKSWGYNPADILAIESALGGPDEFKRFVKAAHQRGIAVLVDVVHNHYGPSDLATWQFDGWNQNGKGGIYFFNDNRSSTLWGDSRPDYSRTEVRNYIKDQIRMFLDEYHVDGFRWDSVFSMIYYNNGAAHLAEGESLLREINEEVNTTHPGTIRIAEDHGFDYNMSFDSVWEFSFFEQIKYQVTRSTDAERNMYWLADKITSWPSFQRVMFSESHDSVGDLNSHYRLPRDIDSANPTSIWARKRQLLAASIVLTSPGTPMIFQGQEMHETLSFSSQTSLRWSLTNTWKGIVGAYSDLIHLRRNLIGGTQGLKGTGVATHHIDNTSKLLAYVRWDQGGQVDDVVVAANFAAQALTNSNYNLTFPSTGKWYTWFNSDSTNYGSDFGGVGNSFVVATGSPARAAINIGGYSTLIFSKTPPPQAGLVTLDPEAPNGCLPVEITYDPATGPLSNSSPVYLRIGVNGWQGVADFVMTNNGAGGWAYTFPVPNETALLDFTFHNGATTNRIWDNNLGRDWHLGVAGCANQPGAASTFPASPIGCVPVTVRYDENSGVLKNATNLNLFIGHNGWQGISTIPMTESPSGVWTCVHVIPDETWQLDFVFNDSGVVWDNHSTADWHVFVADCLDPDVLGLVITNPASDEVVSESTSNVTVTGQAGSDMAGELIWTNMLTGAGGVIPVSSNWTLAALALSEGANLLKVSGTNNGINPNMSSRDAASNFIYTKVPSWMNGQDGGNGWGGGWQLAANGNSGHFLASLSGGGSANMSTGPFGWGLWANSGGLSEASRPLAGPLRTGDVFRVRFDNNWIDGGNSVGLAFQNRFAQNLAEFYFIGGDTNYLLNDAMGSRPTGIPWTGEGLDLQFEITDGVNYTITVNTQAFQGVLAVSSESLVRRIRVWNASAGGGFEHNVYLEDLRIDGLPGESESFNDEITITRPFGPLSDQDDDGFQRWEEELAGTDPADAGSHLPDIPANWTQAVLTVQLPQSTPDRWYDIFCRTNLMEGGWTRCGLDALGWGGPLTLSVTNQDDSAFYRTGVFSP